MERDKFWDDSVPKELPYTIEALPFRHETDISMTEKDHDVPVFRINGHGPSSHIHRKFSTHSLHSVSTSIFSSIKDAMVGRKHSRTDSLWSHDHDAGALS